jgi:tyrosinase
VRSRFDDFVAVHINQTQRIHYNGYFLGWHRYFTWLYEKALREECGYQGYAPYWDWSLDYEDPTKSPIWSGDEYSLSGDGAVDPNNNGTILGAGTPGELIMPPGAGGGCVYSGPFKDMKVNLGPADLGNDAPGPVAALNYNPRCLKRDINAWCSQRWLRPEQISNLINNYTTVLDFQNILQGVGVDFAGPHGGGHFTFGGDPGKDLYVSPGDPSFYLHHGQVDHVWWQWQQKNPAIRTHEIGGTQTFLNNPPSANVTLEDVLDLSPLGPPVKLGQLLSTTREMFCYTYI